MQVIPISHAYENIGICAINDDFGVNAQTVYEIMNIDNTSD